MAERNPQASGEVAGVRDVQTASGRSVLDQYYAAFNQRQFVDAAALFTEDAVLDQLPQLRQEPGAIGYLQFVSTWLRAFPDAQFVVRRISSEDARTFDVALDALGTHRGALDIAGWVFRPTGVQVSLGVREVIEIRDGRIAFSSLIFNLHEFVDKLAQVDASRLLDHVERLRELAEALRRVGPTALGAREITADIGRELDAARHVVRPYYKRRPPAARVDWRGE